MTFETIKGLEEVQKHYETSAQATGKYSFFIYGPMGAGKTRAALTIPGPGHVISFDPGGTKILKHAIKSGRITVDTRFEDTEYHGDESDPFKAFQAEFNRLSQAGVFKTLAERKGFFMVDSGTFMLEALLHSVAKDPMEKITLPEYGKAGLLSIPLLTALVNIPCNFILTGHLEMYKDDVEGKLYAGILVSGKKLKAKLPLLFDEVYFIETEELSKGKVSYTYLTGNNGKYQARTRMGGEGIFALREPAHIGDLMYKAGVITKLELLEGGCLASIMLNKTKENKK